MNCRFARCNPAWLSLLPVLAAAALAHATPRYVATHDVIIEYHVAAGCGATEADLWVSTDGGRSWERSVTTRIEPTTLQYFAPANGKYDFYLVLRNEAGTSGDPPQAGTSPVATVVVDTVPPLIQVHEARLDDSAEVEPASLLLRTSLIEENLSEAGVRVFYRTTEGEWVDGGPATVGDGTITWTPPDDAGPVIDLRIVATDLAGNSASSEILDVALTESLEIASASEPAPDAAAKKPLTDSVRAVEPVAVEPVVVAPVLPAPADPQLPAPAVRRETTETPQLQHLRELADRFMGEGRPSLAAARLEDALELSPQDADLLVDVGSALYRMGRYDDANEQFQSAVTALPDHTGALEGLALVAATQKRYPEAREHLQHLLRLLPESSNDWLRYGDIEHRLGNSTKAFDAWERALNLAPEDAKVFEMAQRRLEYFRPARKPGRPENTGD